MSSHTPTDDTYDVFLTAAAAFDAAVDDPSTPDAVLDAVVAMYHTVFRAHIATIDAATAAARAARTAA